MTQANYSSEDGKTPTGAWARLGFLLVLAGLMIREAGILLALPVFPSALDWVLSCSPVVSRVGSSDHALSGESLSSISFLICYWFTTSPTPGVNPYVCLTAVTFNPISFLPP